MRTIVELCRAWVVVALLGALTACSNGRGSVNEPSAPVGGDPAPPQPQPPPQPPPPQPPPPAPPEPPPPQPPPPDPPPASSGAALAGYWTGSATRQRGDDDDDDDGDGDDRDEHPARAFVDAQGNAHLVVLEEQDDDFLVYGDACCAASVNQKFDGARYLSSRDEQSDFRAALATGQLTGELEFRNHDYRFALSLHGASSQGVSMQQLAGVYTRTTHFLGLPLSTLTISINGDGVLTGSHSSGCVLNGSASIPDAARNIVRFDVRMEQCGSQFGSSRRWNGEYTGLGALLRNSPAPGNSGSREDTLLLSLVGPTWLGLMSVGR